MNLFSTLCAASTAIFLSIPSVLAQEVVVDFDDSALGAPATIAPFYTPGAGGAMLTVREQLLCPSTFGALPTSRMRCTRVGFQLAGSGTYDQFELRAGVAGAPMLDAAWAVNLPNQTLQFDGAFVPFNFGPAATWVEFPLAQPFEFNPGEGVVVDLITHVAPFSVGQVLMPVATTMESGRLVEFDYQGLPTAAGGPRTTGGIKFRLVFEPINAPYSFGAGCSAAPSQPIGLDGTGLAAPGGSFAIDLTNVSAAGAFLFVGFSESVSSFGPLPFSFGGGCHLLTSIDIAFSLPANGMGNSSMSLAVPNNPGLIGQRLFFQGGEVNLSSPAALFPLVFSNGLGVEFQ